MHYRCHPLVRWFSGCVTALALAISVLPAMVSAQGATGTIRGTVTSSASGGPLANAQIQIVGTQLGAITNANGAFSIPSAPAGTHVLRARLIGYLPNDRSIVVSSGATAERSAAVYEPWGRSLARSATTRHSHGAKHETLPV